ncbi:hypothetical protein MHU86_12202 [Fragilaria crotonensis]|nr:hypothetical protein MHU86_12202 [Fragilaria crotonensis]
MLEHLRTEYGTLTPEELEKNRAALSEPWNFDDPIEDLWAKIVNIQRVALFGAVPIADITIITLTLAMIEKTGLLATTTEKFRLRPITEWTVAAFKADFILGNKERIRRLTAGDAGFHGAHNAIIPATPQLHSPAIAAAAVTPPQHHLLRHVMSPLKEGKCFIAGHMDSVPNATIHPSRVFTKRKGTVTMQPLRMRGGNNTISSGRPSTIYPFPTAT